MKKIAAFLLALTMLAGITAAFAATPSAEDVEYVETIGEGDIAIVWTDDPNPGDDAGTGASPLEEIREAQKNGSALDVLPQELRDQLPEGYTQVNEIGSMKLEGNLDNLDGTAELKAAIKFETPYDENEVVYLVIGIPGEKGNEWVLLKGVTNAKRNVEVTFDHDTLMKIGTNTFAIMAVSEA